MHRRQWDIFCKVIDNFGDIGISWRLGADLAARGQQVRLWVDDASALAWMAPAGAAYVEVLNWSQAKDATALQKLQAAPGEVLVEAFGCEIPPEFLAAWVASPPAEHETGAARCCWLNLEYLSSEAYVERSHALPSPVRHGPVAGGTKWFYYPGFTPRTGGLLREPGLVERMSAFETDEAEGWLLRHGLQSRPAPGPAPLRVSLLCYEPPALGALLAEWAARGLAGRPVELLVTAGRSAQAVRAALARLGVEAARTDWLGITWLPWLSQQDFDKLLWACDLNFVRGEDSVLRAVWTGKPFVWQIYPQEDAAHRPKLAVFLKLMGAPQSLQAFHTAWNEAGQTLTLPDAAGLAEWQTHARAARVPLLAQDDLTSRLLQFVAKNR
jgi:uncharacterized repeat protein (TIGR03837 family)